MKKTKNLIFSAVIILIISAYIYFSDFIGKTVSSSVNICLTIIIPSMYGFMIISSVILKSGIHRTLSRPFRIISEYFFRIPCDLFSVFLISCFAGYPVGIKMIYQLFDENEIDKDTADYMSCFCFASGPAFILGTVAENLFSDKKIGMIIFISITISNIITVLIMRFGRKIPVSENKKIQNVKISSSVITEAVESSAKSMLSICAMIIGFSVFSAISEKLMIFNYIADFINKITSLDYHTAYTSVLAFFEISRITEFEHNNSNLIPLMTSLLAFGGICVLVQAISLSGGRLNLKKFLFSRFISAVSSGIICRLILNKLNIYISVSTFSGHKLYNTDYSVIPSVFLFIMTLLLLKELKMHSD